MNFSLFDETSGETPHAPDGEWVRGSWQFGFPEGTLLEIRFECPECGELAYSEEFYVPGLNVAAEKSRDLAITVDFDASCDSCGTDFDLYVESEPGGAHVGTYTGDLTRMTCDHRVTKPAPEYDDYFENYLDAVTSNTEFYQTFSDGARNLRKLVFLLPEEEGEPHVVLGRLLYAHIITLVETYLSDAFINTVLADESLIQTVALTDPELKNLKLSLKDLLGIADPVRRVVERHLAQVIYHRLEKVKEMYNGVLKINLPKAQDLHRAILSRHDIVHRNGRTKTGDIVKIDPDTIIHLLDTAETFVREIDMQIGNRRKGLGS